MGKFSKIKIPKKKKIKHYTLKEFGKDVVEDIKDMGRDLVDPETYKSVGEGYKMVGQDIYKKVKPLLAKKGGGKAYYKGGKVK
jgi:hypothetical protein|tara:strand:+ start:473 stop:721 length:249 start_codon:yes stop_codon:yes gene_type:complete